MFKKPARLSRNVRHVIYGTPPGLEVKFIWECSGVAVVDMGVSKNRGTPNSPILIGFAIINHPFWGTTFFWKHPYIYCNYLDIWTNSSDVTGRGPSKIGGYSIPNRFFTLSVSPPRSLSQFAPAK